MFHLIESNQANTLTTSARRLLAAIHDGTMFSDDDAKKAPIIEAADTLQTTIEAIGAQIDDDLHTSPFTRYRNYVIGTGPTAHRMADLVANLDGKKFVVELGDLLSKATDAEKRAALHMIVSFASFGQDDRAFKVLATEVVDLLKKEYEDALDRPLEYESV